MSKTTPFNFPELSQLHQLLAHHFSLDGLRTLCLDLGVRFDDLGSDGITAKARELILYMQRQNRLQALVEVAAIRRPTVP